MMIYRLKHVLDFNSPILYARVEKELRGVDNKRSSSRDFVGEYSLKFSINNVQIVNQLRLIIPNYEYEFIKNDCYKEVRLVFTDKNPTSLGRLINGCKVIKIDKGFSGNFVDKLKEEITIYFEAFMKSQE